MVPYTRDAFSPGPSPLGRLWSTNTAAESFRRGRRIVHRDGIYART